MSVKQTATFNFSEDNEGNNVVVVVPSQTLESDYMVVIISTTDQNPALTVTPPSGWTLQFGPITGNGAGSPGAEWFYDHTATAADETNAGSATYTWSFSGLEEQVGVVLLFDPASWGEEASNVVTGNGRTAVAPDLLTTVNEEVAVHGATRDDEWFFDAAPSGTEIINDNWGSGSPSGASMQVVHEEYATPQQTGTKTFTLDSGNNTDERQSWAFSVRPSGAITKQGTDVSYVDPQDANMPVTVSHTLVAGTNRIVVLKLMIENQFSIGTVSGTYGGQTVTFAAEATATEGSGYANVAAVGYILETNLPSNGANTASIDISGTVGGDTDVSITVEQYQGVSQTAPSTSSDMDADNQTSGTTITNTVTGSTGDLFVSVASMGAPGAFTWDQSQVELYDVQDASSQAGGAELIATGAITTLNTTTAGTVNRFTRAMIRFAPSFASITGAATLSGTGSLTASGKRNRFAASTISGTGSLSTSGTRITFEGATLSGTGSISVSGVRTKLGSATLSGTGSLSASGTVTPGFSLVTGVATLSGTGSLSSSGDHIGIGVATLSGTGSLSTSGTRTTFEGATLSGTGSLSASGKRNRFAGVTLSGTGSLSVSGTRITFESATLTGVGSLSASGVVASIQYGFATLSGTGSLSASATLNRFAAITLLGTGSLSSSAFISTFEEATLSALGSLTASGVINVRPVDPYETGKIDRVGVWFRLDGRLVWMTGGGRGKFEGLKDWDKVSPLVTVNADSQDEMQNYVYYELSLHADDSVEDTMAAMVTLLNGLYPILEFTPLP